MTTLPVPTRPNAGQWQPGQSGNPLGRPRGARSLLSERVLQTLAEDFREHGPAVVVRVRQEDPKFYLGLVAHLIPKELAAAEPDPIDSATIEETTLVLEAIREAIARREEAAANESI